MYRHPTRSILHTLPAALRTHHQPQHLHILCTTRFPMTPHPAAQDTDNTAFCTIRRRMHLRKPLWHAHARTCANICDTYRPGPGVHSVSAQPTTSGDIATKWLAVGTSAGAPIIELAGLHQPRRRKRQSRADAQRPPGTHDGTLPYAMHAVSLCASEHDQHSCTADAATVHSAPHNSIIFTYPGNLPTRTTHCCCCSCCWCRTYSAESRQQHLGNYHCLLLLLLLKVFMLRLVLTPPPQALAGLPTMQQQ
jgi:hypothetical protein